MSEADETDRQPDVPDWWMDGGAEPAADAACSACDALDARARLRAANQQLIHALLSHLHPAAAAARNDRVARAMAAIRALPAEAAVAEEVSPARLSPAARPARRRTRWLAPWAVAASLVIGIATWMYVSTTNSAVAALAEVMKALEAPVDRTYDITVEPSDEPLPPRDRGQPAPADRRPGLNGAVLYVRGGNQFVLVRATINHEEVINGSNGRENWLVRPRRPVLVSDSAREFRLPIPEGLATIPFVDIRLTLSGLREGYRIAELSPENLADDPATRWRHLQATKLDPATRGPKTVSLWFHPDTHLIGRMQFDQVNLQGRAHPRRLTITLVGTQPLAANWFDHAAHHAAQAPVECVEP